MKTFAIIITFFALIFSCKKKENNIHKKEISISKINDFKDSNLALFKKLGDKKVIITNTVENEKSFNNVYVIDKDLKQLNDKPLHFLHRLMDIEETDSGYIILSSDIHTMKKETQDYLSYYNKNWDLVWQKPTNITKLPNEKSFLQLINDTSYYYISNKWTKLNINKKEIVIKKYNLEMNILGEVIIKSNDFASPRSVLKLKDDSFIAAFDVSSYENRRYKSKVIKFDSNFNENWAIQLNHFYPHKIVKDKNEAIILLGDEGYSLTDAIIKLNSNGTIIWRKAITDFKVFDIEIFNGYIFLLCKNLNNELYVLKMDSLGEILNQEKINIRSDHSDEQFLFEELNELKVFCFKKDIYKVQL